MTEVSRITPEEAYQKLGSGDAIIVCAYDSEEKFRSHQLAGAISLSEFRGKLPSLSQDQEIIFYCAWSDEHTSARVAAELIQQGYVNAKALLGGVAAWQQAGLPVIGVNQWERIESSREGSYEPEFDRRALIYLSYGLYIVTSLDGKRLNGQIVNTVIQVASDLLLLWKLFN